jgi:hypothetical protein
LPRSHQKTEATEDHQTGGDMAAIHIGISGLLFFACGELAAQGVLP